MPSFLARALPCDWVLASIGEVGKRVYCVLVDLPVDGALSWYDAHAAAVSNRNEPLAPEGGHGRLADLLPPKLGVILDICAGQ
jgi:hypothetical protein